jgi:hypothetical protein
MPSPGIGYATAPAATPNWKPVADPCCGGDVGEELTGLRLLGIPGTSVVLKATT